MLWPYINIEIYNYPISYYSLQVMIDVDVDMGLHDFLN